MQTKYRQINIRRAVLFSRNVLVLFSVIGLWSFATAHSLNCKVKVGINTISLYAEFTTVIIVFALNENGDPLTNPNNVIVTSCNPEGELSSNNAGILDNPVFLLEFELELPEGDNKLGLEVDATLSYDDVNGYIYDALLEPKLWLEIVPDGQSRSSLYKMESVFKKQNEDVFVVSAIASIQTIETPLEVVSVTPTYIFAALPSGRIKFRIAKDGH